MNNKSNRKPTEKQLAAMREKREELKAISKPFKKLVEQGEISNINEGLVAMYAEDGHTVLKTMKQWNKEGKKIIKGEHAFLLWGKPQPIKNRETPPEPDKEEEDPEFFPICFVFSQHQVEQGRATA